MSQPITLGLRRSPIAFLLACALAAVLGGCAPRSEAAQVRPSPDLRARVEQLKRDVAAAPTTADTVFERAATLWEWTNAFALDGGIVPVNLTTIPTAVARARATGQPIPADGMADLDGFAPVLVRQPAEIPAADLRLGLSDLVDGRLEREFQVDVHTDRILVQVVDPQAPLDQEAVFTDLDPPKPGDYYCVRVTQLDSGRAWSSPFWVGN